MKDHEIARLEGLYSTGQKSAGFEVVRPRAVLEDAQTVRLIEDGRRVRARTILIATGSRPELPQFDGVELGITSDDIFDKTFPKKLVIGGAGYIAIEFAGLFATLEATSPSSAVEAMSCVALTRTCDKPSPRPTQIVASN